MKKKKKEGISNVHMVEKWGKTDEMLYFTSNYSMVGIYKMVSRFTLK